MRELWPAYYRQFFRVEKFLGDLRLNALKGVDEHETTRGCIVGSCFAVDATGEEICRALFAPQKFAQAQLLSA